MPHGDTWPAAGPPTLGREAMTADDYSVAVHRALEAVDRGWLDMCERCDPVVRRVRIAETDVEIVLAGDQLADILLPGFECHAAAAREPVATVGAWDALATGFAIPPPLASDNPLVRHWTVRRDGRPVAEIDWADEGAIRIGDRRTGRHLLGIASADALSPWEAGAPLRRGLWWALGPEALFVHAGAVATDDGAALIMGASGAGKSTTSLACLRAGMDFLSDDYCLVRGDPPVVHLLTATARVHHHELPNFVDLVAALDHRATAPSEDPTMKALFYVDRGAAGQVVRSAPVRVIVVPEVSDDDEPQLIPLRSAEALRIVAPAALKQMHLEADRELAGLRHLIASVPLFRLRLSRHRDRNPIAIEEAIRRAAGSQ